MKRLRTKVRNLAAFMAVAALATGALLALNSCSTTPALVTAPPDIPGAAFVGNKACTECHPRISRIFPDSAHARIHLESAARSGQTGCESCHGAGSLHISSGGARRFIHNPGKDPGACFECHRPTQAEFQLPQHHPLPEKKMNCADCHDPHGNDIQKPASGLAMARVNETCSQCHREQSRPFVFEHQALREGCTTCHSPHGSVNAKLLTQRDSNLCLRCHAQVQNSGVGTGHIFIGNVDHTTYVRMGSCWSSGCHTAVHGSNVDVRLRY
jgi:predicted CXXCH cytochrome family protein